VKMSNLVIFEVFTVVTMKNGVFWNVTPYGSYKDFVFLRNVRRLLVTAYVPSSPILVTLMILHKYILFRSQEQWRTLVSL
jgi:hypothetical protein